MRAGAAKNATGYYDLVGSDRFFAEVMPALREVATDVCLPVRVALATTAMDLAAKIPPALSPQHIIPLAMQLLRDESAEVGSPASVFLLRVEVCLCLLVIRGCWCFYYDRYCNRDSFYKCRCCCCSCCLCFLCCF